MPTLNYFIEPRALYPKKNRLTSRSHTAVQRLLAVMMGIWLLIGTATWGVTAETTEIPPEVKRLQAFLDRLHSVEADFYQRLLDNDEEEPKISQGQFSAARPGRFRWDYTEPFKQLIVADGQTIWFYEPDLKQVTKSSAERLDKSPAVFLTSNKRLEETFRWHVIPGPQADQPTIMLHPKEEGSLRWIAIALHPTRDEITDFMIEDSLHHRSRILFKNWRPNTKIPAERFHFTPPPGVDVIDDQEIKTQ